MDRIKERKKEEKNRQSAVRKQKLLQYKRIVRSKLPMIGRYVFGIIFLSFFVYIVAGTDIFTIDTVKVSSASDNGFKYTDREELRMSAENIVSGVNFFVLNPNNVTTTLLIDFPYVESIYAEKKFPSLLELKATEKEVIFLVEYGNECLPIDDNGGIVMTIEKEENCSGIANTQEAIYTKISEEAYDSIRSQSGFFLFDQLFQLREMMYDIGYEIERIDVEERKVVVNVGNSQLFIFDPFEEFDTQLKRAALVLNDLDAQDQFKEIDFRFIRPVLR